MKAKPVRVFISHHHSDKCVARMIKDRMRTYHLDCFIAHSDIEVSEEWENRIRRELSRCDAVVALLNRQFRKSMWCDQEIGWALARAVPVISIMCGDQPHGFLGRYQGIETESRDAKKMVYAVVGALLKNAHSRSHTTDNLVVALQQSGKFDVSNEIADLLYLVPILLKRQVHGIESAILENPQVGDADWWKLPNRLRRIIKSKNLKTLKRKA